jgi:hypothetical protein
MPSLSDAHELLDALILRSLADLAADLRSAPWFGRENELISLFVFEHLLRVGARSPGAVLPGQVGIEAAVPQLPDCGERRKTGVRKDVVIWPTPRTTCWAGPRRHGEAPAVVTEWKTLSNVVARECRRARRAASASDIAWLTRVSLTRPRWTYHLLSQPSGQWTAPHPWSTRLSRKVSTPVTRPARSRSSAAGARRRASVSSRLHAAGHSGAKAARVQ